MEKISYEKVEKGYRIITFEAILPFSLVGFLSKISTALAKKGVSILAISSFSTDHILVKEENLEKAREALEKIGITCRS